MIVLLASVVIGLALGTLATFILLRYGWKPALALTLAVAACGFVVTEQTGLNSTVEGAVLVAFGASRFLAEPLLKKHVQR